jgi:hypothetical protein
LDTLEEPAIFVLFLLLFFRLIDLEERKRVRSIGETVPKMETKTPMIVREFVGVPLQSRSSKNSFDIVVCLD